MRHRPAGVAIGAALVAAVVAACSSTSSIASHQSPPAVSPPSLTTPGASPSRGQSPSPIPSATSVDPRLVIVDYGATEVRLARLDAVDTARLKGQFDGVVVDQVIVLNGNTLQALSRSGKVTSLGRLAGTPNWIGPGSVVLKGDLSQWLYALTDTSWTASIHLGTPAGDKVIATLTSPDGSAYYRPFAWIGSGIYMVREATGLGGAGPFLEYHMPLAQFDMSSGHVTEITPQCIAYDVLEDGTLICGQSTQAGKLEVRSRSGAVNVIQLATGTNGFDAAYIDVAVSPDDKRVIAGRNGAKDPVINYQVAVADLSSSRATAFGPIDYFPNTWLPDGRVVATHSCVIADFGGGACNASLDGTYIFKADGSSHALFFKLGPSSTVAGYI